MSSILSSMAAVPGITGTLPDLSSMAATTKPFAGAPSFGMAQPSSEPAPFSNLLSDAVGQVSKLQDDAASTVTGLLNGSGVDVHQAMIATGKASAAFELSLAVRNKAIQAYQSVIGMQF